MSWYYGPQISMWINSKIFDVQIELEGNGSLDCLASGQTSQVAELFVEMKGKPLIFFILDLGICPNLTCHKNSSLVVDENKNQKLRDFPLKDETLSLHLEIKKGSHLETKIGIALLLTKASEAVMVLTVLTNDCRRYNPPLASPSPTDLFIEGPCNIE